MPTDQWQRVQKLFEQAVDRSPEERAVLLAEACGDDAKLRAEVESLLDHDSRVTDDFLRPAQPPAGIRRPSTPDGPDPMIGGSIGGYQIKGVIAGGGMGTVYEAVQEQPRRIVALKVMRHNVASRSALRRFQFESQILGRLRHPNIAQVYQAGMHGGREGILGPAEGPLADGRGSVRTDPSRDREQADSPSRDREGADNRGRDREQADSPSRDREGAVMAAGVPYFAMEYIPGAKTITEHAEEKKLGTRDRLRLLARACDAVHHGHQKGIIHRDLKPANILVDSTGEPKVIDFGVARATDSDLAVTTQQTCIGELVGTVQYMSPEQCDADPHDIDTRSDVYSLGVVLYELLTGELPYDATGTTIFQATRIIKEQAPRALSAINAKLRGDVETITLKALEKDRDRRYQSAAELAQDIRRHLNREPIEARPPTAWTRGVRWVSRNPVIATTAACLSIAAVVVLATCVSVWLVNARAYNIELVKQPGHEQDPRGYEARLLARSGRILHTWPAEQPFGMRFAELVDRPAELGGGKLGVLGYTSAQGNPFPGSLRVFDTGGDLENPIWRDRIETEDILPQLRDIRGFVAEQFQVCGAWVLDVFPQRPGSEIVALYSAGIHSQRVLRIYDLTGEPLYQVWHDGCMEECYWMSDAGLLVFAGDSHGPYHDPHGKLVGDRVKDVVVFALRPKAGFIGADDYLPSTPADDPLSPVWYLRLRPDDVPEVARGVTLHAPDHPNDPGRCVKYSVQVEPQVVGLAAWWVIDEFGREVEGTRNCSDAYKRNQNLPDGHPDKLDLPDPNSFYLGPLPPIQSTSADAEQSPDDAEESSGAQVDPRGHRQGPGERPLSQHARLGRVDIVGRMWHSGPPLCRKAPSRGRLGHIPTILTLTPRRLASKRAFETPGQLAILV